MSDSAVYAGSFDPPTNGHVWMIEQGARLFDKLIVAVARNPEKGYSYELDQRVGWLSEICRNHDNVEVKVIENEFLAHYAARANARFVIRGIRNEADYEQRSQHEPDDGVPDAPEGAVRDLFELCQGHDRPRRLGLGGGELCSCVRLQRPQA